MIGSQLDFSRAAPPANEEEERLMAALTHEPRHVDEVARESGLAAGEVSATLALLELKGLVRDLGGMQFVRVREAAAGHGGSGDGDHLTSRSGGTSDPGREARNPVDH